MFLYLCLACASVAEADYEDDTAGERLTEQMAEIRERLEGLEDL